MAVSKPTSSLKNSYTFFPSLISHFNKYSGLFPSWLLTLALKVCLLIFNLPNLDINKARDHPIRELPELVIISTLLK